MLLLQITLIIAFFHLLFFNKEGVLWNVDHFGVLEEIASCWWFLHTS